MGKDLNKDSGNNLGGTGGGMGASGGKSNDFPKSSDLSKSNDMSKSMDSNKSTQSTNNAFDSHKSSDNKSMDSKSMDSKSMDNKSTEYSKSTEFSKAPDTSKSVEFPKSPGLATASDSKMLDIDKTASTAHSTIDKALDAAQPMADRLATTAHASVDKLTSALSGAGASMEDRSKQLTEAYNKFADTGREYVRSSPATSVLVALAAGYTLSKLLGRRH